MTKEKNRDATSFLLPLRLWIGRKLFGEVVPHGVRVSPGRMIKGPCPASELAALKYVAEHTSIPVPRVFNAHYYQNDLYIEMDYIRGMNLGLAWGKDHISQDQKKSIIIEVAGYISQLRKLKPPREGIVASASLGALMDHRVGSYVFGPFTSHEGFHTYLRANLRVEDCDKSFCPEVTECHTRQYRSCFTHADLAPRNIMIHNGKVSAVVDWQFGGWYPEYWEYTKAHYGQTNRSEWYRGLEANMERYDAEFKAEQALWEKLDDPQFRWRGYEHLIPDLLSIEI
ncbi:hypothetical protein N7541_000586 [Penicillium brevicompactum]|uniref:Aminoglycoside phosphotransferase domain-containing protein n=1 Tax=Penicillium brevicompactum TaxID=5074 RepID=A0A9W9RVZ2_PENBR|nr:hypothetical protein N7541_000586 [Penicillium brevicompactum]